VDANVVVSGAIGLVGAVIGAGAGAFTQLRLASKHAEERQEQHDQDRVMAARMMMIELARHWSNLEYTARLGIWWRMPTFDSILTHEDRRLILGTLDPRGLYGVDLALTSVEYWSKRREGKKDDEAVEDSQRESMRDVLGRIERAGAVLRQITGDPESVRDIAALGPVQQDEE
jgi:hypothetical protein